MKDPQPNPATGKMASLFQKRKSCRVCGAATTHPHLPIPLHPNHLPAKWLRFFEFAMH